MEINPADVEHDDVTGDVLVRLLSGRVVEDPNSKDKKDVLWLQADISPEEIIQICQLAGKSFEEQQVLLEIDRTLLPIHVVADLHGQISHLLRLLHTIGSPQRETYLFLGDYVDRGVQGVELMILLFCLKIRYPFQVFLLRGNHEDVNTNLNYGFYEECLERYNRFGQGMGEQVWRAFLGAFNWMPMAALIKGKKSRIFCCHGGISPFINNLEDINSIPRPHIIPPYGIACDLVWADPNQPGNNGWSISHRGISFLFGQDILDQFCKRHNIDLVLRGHQINEKMYRCGYKMNPGGRLITFFSAVNYMNYKNNGAVVKIDPNLKVTFLVYRVKIYGNSELTTRKKGFMPRKKSSRAKRPGSPTTKESDSDSEHSKFKAPRSDGPRSRALTPSKYTSMLKSGSEMESPKIHSKPEKTVEAKGEKTPEKTMEMKTAESKTVEMRTVEEKSSMDRKSIVEKTKDASAPPGPVPRRRKSSFDAKKRA